MKRVTDAMLDQDGNLPYRSPSGAVYGYVDVAGDWYCADCTRAQMIWDTDFWQIEIPSEEDICIACSECNGLLVSDE